MEDDDEFGDLYTDVLQPLQMSSAPPQPPIQSTPQPISRSIDLNDRIPSDDEEILFGSKSSGNLKFDQPYPNLNSNKIDGAASETEKYRGEDATPVPDSGARVLGSNSGLMKVKAKGFEQDLNVADDNKAEFSQNKDEMMEENFGIEDAGEEEEFLIPGLSSSGARVLEPGGNLGEIGDDWDDSDSEDDLQIVLNDNTGVGMMGMDGGVGLDEEDEDNLVIVTGNSDPNRHHHHHPQLDELQDWGEDGNQTAEIGGERKDLSGGDAGKADGGAQKMGYGSHGYHPFHSQFKYVRPGAAPIPGGGPVGPGQVRPPGSVLPFAGRGRGEWRAPGIKNGPNMQKTGYGNPGFGAGRGFGSGLDFTLPSHKTIFEVDIDGFEEKPWRLEGMDVSDFFNFGMNEESWKEYCTQLEQHRMEATMQSKIRVYESGRTEREYDPDLPPELAAAAGHDISSDNRNVGKTDMQNDLSARARMQLPTGKAIQVETGFGERLPSIDTRPPRTRDSDAIIEIVLQRSPDHESIQEDDVAENLEDIPAKESYREMEDDIVSEENRFDRPQAYNGRKREASGRRGRFVGSVDDVASTRDRSSHYSETEMEKPGKKHNSPRNHTERKMKRPAADRSPRLTDSGTPQDKKIADNQNEESNESVDHKHSPSSSPLTIGSPENQSFDQNHVIKEDPAATNDTIKDEKSKRVTKKQKLTAEEHFSVERSSENNKPRPGSIEQEVIQTRSSGSFRKPVRARDEIQDRRMEDPYSHSHRKWESNQGYRSHMKPENFDMRKRNHDEEMVSRHRSKVREPERIDKNEHRSRKPVENGLKTRNDVRDNKRETGLRESPSRRKRERDDNLEQYKREEARLRDGHRSARSRMKEDYRKPEKEYPFKEPGRPETESVSRHRAREDAYAHGNNYKVNNEERISSRHERGFNSSAKDGHGGQDKKHKETLKKGKEIDHNLLTSSRKNKEDHSSQRASSRGMHEQQRTSDQNPKRSSKKHKENVSSEDEQHESKKGRSKLERWTRHKDRDFNPGIKDNNTPLAKLPEESQKPQENLKNYSKPLTEEKDDTKPAEDKHLDTVEKLKKRSERFKLPMPSGKEGLTVKKIENDPLPPVQPETRPETEVKPERPARKRRWTSG